MPLAHRPHSAWPGTRHATAPLAEALEDRILHSADLAPLALAGGGLDAALQAPLTAAHDTAVPAQRQEIVFFDATLPDADTLLADLRAQRDAGRALEIVSFGADDDALALIGQTLASRQDVTAVHVISHGSDGVLQLGRVQLDANTVLQRAGELAAWSAALAPGADLLLYGCDLAATDIGRGLVADLAALSGADVAASVDRTGAAALGGNWVLEQANGGIEAGAALSASAQQAWSHALSAPTLNSASMTLQEGRTVTLAPSNFSVSWADSGPSFQIMAVSGGYFQLSTATGVAISVFTPDQLSAAQVQFVDDGNQLAPSFSVRARDSGGDSVARNATISYTPVNDAPQNSVPGSQVTGRNTPLTFSAASANPLSVSDEDLGAGPVRITLTVSGGTLTLNGTSGLSFSSGANASAVMTFTGTLTAANTALDGLVFAPAAGFTGSVSLSLVSNDQGGSGSGGALSDTAVVAITVVDRTLWLSTEGNTTSSASSGGLSWNKGQVVELANPNLVLGSGTNGGTFGQVFNLNALAADGGADLVGLHVVGRTVSIGTVNAVVVQAGDVLFSVDDNETFGGLAVNKEQVVRFRPTAPGDYSAGSFAVVFTNPTGLNNDVLDFALVETPLSIAGTALQAGDFLMSFHSGGYDKDIWLYRPTNVGTNPAGGTMTELVNGDSVGVNLGNDKIRGIELVQQDTVIGGKSLSAGQLLISQEGDNLAGLNLLSVQDGDIFVLSLTQTGIAAIGTTTMFMRGADLGLSGGGSERPDGIALVQRGSAAPLVTLGAGTTTFTEGGGAVLVTPSASVSDSDSPSMAGGRLTVYIDDQASADDRLAVQHVGTGAGQIGVSGSTLSFGGVVIGSATGGTDGATPLTVTFNASATPAAVQVLLNNIVFSNGSDAPSTLTRRVSISLADGAGGVSAPVSRNIAVVAVNDVPTGLPGITGTVTEDQTLTANVGGIADADGLTGATFAYQWLRGGAAISGATASTYALGDGDVGALISVQVSYTDDQGTPETLTSAQTAAALNVNDAPAGLPVISGTVTEDQTLSVDTSGISDADGLGAFSYQWLRGGAVISGATGANYTLSDNDVGALISVRVSYTDIGSTVETLSSAQTAAVLNINDAPGGLPVITGTATEDQTLSVDTSGISDADGPATLSFAYQWLRNGSAISGATAATYLLGDADVGQRISVRVSYTDAGSNVESLTSAQTAAVLNINDAPAGLPVISGTVTEDQTLSVATSGISDADGLGAFSYQWLRGGAAISGATGSTYTLGDNDVGWLISVRVSYTDIGSTVETLTSAQTTAVLNINDAPAGLPVITGTVAEDQTLSVNAIGISDADGPATLGFAYQWLRNGSAISGATGTSYTLGDYDVGQRVSVSVSYTDAGSNVETLTSAQTAAVLNINDTRTGLPVISGTVTEDQTLSVDASGISDADGPSALSFTYQWLRNGSAVGGATGATYVLGDNDVGQRMSVRVSYTDAQNTAETATSVQTALVQNINDLPSGLPVISGTVTEDQTLSVDTSGINDADGPATLSFTYQWLRNGNAVSGATGAAYVLGDNDVGQRMSVRVSYIDAQNTAETATRVQTALVQNINDLPSGLPVISGTVTEDQTLSVDTSGISDADGPTALSFTYQWLRNGSAISGATATSYTVNDADVGQRISVRVSYTDTQNTAETLTSAQTAAVINLNDTPTGLPVISGMVTEDQTLSVDTSGISDADGPATLSFAYQWLRNGSAISGATGTSYTLGDNDVGQRIGIRVSYTDTQNTAETVTSVQTAVVQNLNDSPTGLPVITGSVTRGYELTADASAIHDVDALGAFGYQWQRDGIDIAGATDARYLLTQDDIGARMRVVVRYVDGQGTVETVNSASTESVATFNIAATGRPTIIGSATEDSVLSVDTGAIADPDGLGSFSFQWLRDGQRISGATASAYLAGDADVGSRLSVEVNFVDGRGNLESLRSLATALVGNVNDTPQGLPIAFGTPMEGETLAADTTGVSDADGLGSFTYQWLRDSSAVSGATGATYMLGNADVGAAISVRVSYTDGQGSYEALPSRPTGPVGNVNDAPSGQPVVLGSATRGQLLLVDASGIRDADGLGVFSYRWQRDGADIAGAVASTYSLGDADVGAVVRVTVRYIDGHGTAESLPSAGTAPVSAFNSAPSGLLRITGTPAEDQTLTAESSDIRDSDGLGAFNYQWLRDGAAIGGATGATYTLGDDDVGSQIGLRLSYVDGSATSEWLSATPTAPVANVNDTPQGLPEVLGTATENSTLAADTRALRDADGLGAFAYQWLRDGRAIAGATGADHTLGDADVGQAISVRVSYVDGQGTAEALTSAATAPVLNVNDTPTGLPLIQGQAARGYLLDADLTGLRDADGLGPFTYQWRRDDSDIAGATQESYRLVEGDVGARLSVVVRYLDGQGTAEQLVSAPTPLIGVVNLAPAGLPAINGSAVEDQVLRADTSALRDADGLGSFAYQWLRGGVAIDGAQGVSYTLGDADVGARISLRVSYLDGRGFDEVLTALPTAPVANVNDAPLLRGVLPGQSVQAGGSTLWLLPADLFSDVDAGDTLHLSARLADGTALPDWLRFDPTTGAFDAAPPLGASGDWAVRVTASDAAGASASVDSTLRITAPPAPEPEAAVEVPRAPALPAVTPLAVPAAAAAPAEETESVVAEKAAPATTPRAPTPTQAAEESDPNRHFESVDATPTRTGTAVSVDQPRGGSRSDAVLADGVVPQFASLNFAGNATLLRSDEWARGFEQLQHELQAQSELRRTTMASGVAAVGSLSVGYVIWLVRGGVLMSSMLSALPAWQMVDPLPVLAAAGATKRARGAAAPGDEEDDEIERLFDEQPDERAAAAPAAPVAQTEAPKVPIQETTA